MNATDEIKARLDIVEIVNEAVPLKKAGRNYKGLCPFHSEKTPSFVVFPETGTWRCFGACGEGGDIFSFVMKREGWDFPEALRVLAERAGVELEPLTPQQTEEQEQRDRLRELLADAATFFHQRLLTNDDANHARGYVAKRGLSQETVAFFEIGYAPDSWDACSEHLMALGYDYDEIADAGMLVIREDDRSYDRFRDRLMIPIRDGRGRIAGFGARALAPDAVPKYLNSPQSALFDKSTILYGLDNARRSIRESETAIIVEGYMDVLQAYQAGFTNIVAQMGTALTESQLRLLARYASRLILALDPDTAGQMATERGMEVIERVSHEAAEQAVEEGVWNLDEAERDYRATLTPEFDPRGMVRYESRLGFDIRVALLPEGMDPDDLIREDPAEWSVLIKQALPIVEYIIRAATDGRDLDDPKEKSRVAADVVPVIEDVSDSVERAHYKQRLARLLRVEERALFPESAPRGRAASPRRATSDPATNGLPATISAMLEVTPTLSLEAFCLKVLLRYPPFLYRVNRVLGNVFNPNLMGPDELPDLDILRPHLTPTDFAHPAHRTVFETWQEAVDQHEVKPEDYLSYWLDADVYHEIDAWLGQPIDALFRGVTPASIDLSDDIVQQTGIRRLLDLRERRIEERVAELRFLVEDATADGGLPAALEYWPIIKAVMLALKRVQVVRHELASPENRRIQPHSDVLTG